MSNVRRLLASGNGKLGEQIMHFDLPAVTTCPGRTAVCEGVCYATTGRFRYRSVRSRLAWCLRQSRRDDFPSRMAREIRVRGALVVRLHVSGDFYDACYAEKWLSVMHQQPHTRYYLYTRHWRVPEVEAILRQMAVLGCCRVWYSCDRDTGVPAVVPRGVRLAYLQDTPELPAQVDLVFRTRSMLRRPRLSLPLLCPNDTPQGRREGTNCGSCGHCFG